MNRDPELQRCAVCDTRLRTDEGAVCDKCAPPTPEADEPLAPAPDHILDLHQRVATIIRKAYFIHTRNERLAHETAIAVLEEVTRTYEQAVAGAEAQQATEQ